MYLQILNWLVYLLQTGLHQLELLSQFLDCWIFTQFHNFQPGIVEDVAQPSGWFTLHHWVTNRYDVGRQFESEVIADPTKRLNFPSEVVTRIALRMVFPGRNYGNLFLRKQYFGCSRHIQFTAFFDPAFNGIRHNEYWTILWCFF